MIELHVDARSREDESFTMPLPPSVDVIVGSTFQTCGHVCWRWTVRGGCCACSYLFAGLVCTLCRERYNAKPRREAARPGPADR